MEKNSPIVCLESFSPEPINVGMIVGFFFARLIPCREGGSGVLDERKARTSPPGAWGRSVQNGSKNPWAHMGIEQSVPVQPVTSLLASGYTCRRNETRPYGMFRCVKFVRFVML